MKILVPFKGIESAKSRWPQLGEKREDLILKLLGHNLQTLSAVVGAQNVYLVTPELQSLEQFDQVAGLRVPGLGLNSDLRDAREQICSPKSEQALGVLLPDLPKLALADVEDWVGATLAHQLVLCPDKDDVGTNAMSMNSPYLIDFLFEGQSFNRHRTAAAQRNLSVKVLRREGLAEDCDDLEALRRFSLI